MSRLGQAVRRTPLLHGLPREVAVLAAIAFCVALGFGIVAPALPVFATSFGVSALAAGAVISAFAGMRLVSAPLAGALVNRIGERLVLSTGLGIVAVSSLLAGFSQSFWQLIMLRGAGGVGSAMFTVSSLALLLRVVGGDQRGRAAGAFQGGFLLGGVAGPAVGGLVVAWSIRAPFFVYAATLFGAMAVTLVFLSRSTLHDLESDAPAAAATGSGWSALTSALRDPAYRAALGVNLSSGFVVFGLRAALVPLFVVEGLRRTPSLAGAGFFCAAAVQGVLLLPAGRIADTVGRRPALLAGMGATIVGMLVLTTSDAVVAQGADGGALSVGLFLLGMTVLGVASAFLGSAPAAVVGDVMGERRGGIVVAAFQMVSDVGAVAGPLIAGALVVALDFDWAFATGAVVALLGLVLVLVMPETLGRPERASA